MYPKSTVSKTTSQVSSKKQQTRQQLSELLINKFRNKYNVNVSAERDLDNKLTTLVSKVVIQDAPVGEKELNELDKVIAECVKTARGSEGQHFLASHSRTKEELKSEASKAPSVQSRSKSIASSSFQLVDVDAQIRAGLQGKVIGMTDAEWNDTVQQNYSKWTTEERQKMQRLRDQRDMMRNELQAQMANKAEKVRRQQEFERSQHQQDLVAIERKLIQDELEKIEHNEQIKKNVSVNKQFEQLNKYKNEQAQRQREKQAEERRLLDEQIKAANIADAKVQEERRRQLKILAEDDRKAKMLQKLLIEAKQKGQPADDAISTVYDMKGYSTSGAPDSRRGQSQDNSKARTKLFKQVGASVVLPGQK